MARHVVKTRPRGAQYQAAGDEHRRAIQRTHITPYIRTARSPDARSPAHNHTHHSNGIFFTSARSPAHAVITLHDRNVTESPTPLGFFLAASKELTACCSACASAYTTLHATRSPACNARSPAHAHRSTDERNLPESTALHAPLLELRTCDGDCAHAPTLFHSSLTHTLPRPRGAWGEH